MRLGMWAEKIGILDENQAGFRKGRSTPDVVQVMVRVQQDKLYSGSTSLISVFFRYIESGDVLA